MTGPLTFPAPPVSGPARGRWLPWIAFAAGLVCVASIIASTLLIPGDGVYPPTGGFIPVSQTAR